MTVDDVDRGAQDLVLPLQGVHQSEDRRSPVAIGQAPYPVGYPLFEVPLKSLRPRHGGVKRVSRLRHYRHCPSGVGPLAGSLRPSSARAAASLRIVGYLNIERTPNRIPIVVSAAAATWNASIESPPSSRRSSSMPRTLTSSFDFYSVCS